MGGDDYGYADVPSISRRDAAMTYRDFVLHDDFNDHDCWFPLANLMTHGIIKGHLERLGGEDDPLDKFTDDVVLYFARGVSMYELYISPDLLTDGEWRAISETVRWARDRFAMLRNGDDRRARRRASRTVRPLRGGAGSRRPQPLHQAGPARRAAGARAGLDADAAGLVLERVYPPAGPARGSLRPATRRSWSWTATRPRLRDLSPGQGHRSAAGRRGVRSQGDEGGRMDLTVYPVRPASCGPWTPRRSRRGRRRWRRRQRPRRWGRRGCGRGTAGPPLRGAWRWTPR